MRTSASFASRFLGCACVFVAGAFAWVVIGFFWWFCTFGYHKKLERVAQHGAATLLGGGLGMLLLVGAYFVGEWIGCRILGRC